MWERCVGWEGLWQDRVVEVLGGEGEEEGVDEGVGGVEKGRW